MTHRILFPCTMAACLLLLNPPARSQSLQLYLDSVNTFLFRPTPDTTKTYLLLRLAQLPECPPDTLQAYGQRWHAYALAHRIQAGRPEAGYAMGLASFRKGQNNEAVAALYKAATGWEASGNNPVQLARTYELIATIYKTLGKHTDALTYYRQSYALKKMQGNESILMSTYNGLGNTFRALDKPDSAFFYLKKCLALADGNLLAMAQVNSNLGNIYFSQQRWQAAIPFYKDALKHFEALGHTAGIAEANFNLGAVATQLNQYRQAIAYYNESLKAAPADQSHEHLEWIYLHLADACYKTGKYEQAYNNLLKHSEIADSTLSLNVQRSIADLKEKYETEKKEHSLALEQARTARLSILNTNQLRFIYVLAGVTLLIAGMGYLLVRNMRRKQLLAAELARAKEKERQQLIQEQALKSSIARLEGKEAERQRISRDLHDRLGSTLSSVRLFMQSSKAGSITTVNNADKVEWLLNEAIDDVRRISHDLSDNVLQQYGLTEALQDLKDTAEATGSMQVDLHHQQTGDLPEHIKTEIYYICRELVNNAMKHSEASHLSIQFLKEDKTLYLTVEDNGKGFDTTVLTRGIGLGNIRTRAEKIHAQYTVDSSVGRGTCFSFTIPL